MREVQTTFPIGTVIRDHYCIEDLLGQGSSGAVYLVRDEQVQDAPGQLFVIKQVIDLDTHKRQRLIFEDVLLRQLSHEALPRVYQVFADDRDDGVDILMEYIEGPNLDMLRHQQPDRRFAWPEAMTIMTPIIDAVSYLHWQQPPLIHGDIKPANIIVKTGSGAVLVGVGIRQAGDPDATLDAGRTRSSLYQAPEQSSGDSDRSTDIYGLGATFYTLLTGMVPADTLARLTAVSNEGIDPLKPVHEVVPDVPAPVAQAIHRAMSLRADDRFSSLEQFWAALRSPGEPRSPMPDTPPASSFSPPPPREAVKRPATVSPPRQSHTPSATPKQAIPRPAAVIARKQSRAPQSSKPKTAPSAAPKQAAEKPAPTPKPPRPPRTWKLSSLWADAHKQTVEKPAPAPKQTVEKPAPAPKPPRSWKLSSLFPGAPKQTVTLSPDHDSKLKSVQDIHLDEVLTAPSATESTVEKPAPAPEAHDVPVVDNLKREDKQKRKSKRQKARSPYFVACALLLLLLFVGGSLFSLVEFQTYNAKYHTDMSLAREGIQHLQKGMALFERLQQNPFDAPTVQKARHEFATSLMLFSQLDSELKSLPGISLSIPTYGARLSAALHLLPIAIEVSQTGVIACNTLDLLISRFHNPLNAQAQGLTMADLGVVNQNFQRIRTTLNLVIGQVNRLQPGDLQLDPRLSKLMTTFHKDIPTLQAWLDVAEKILPVAPAVLGIGTPTNYLIEVLDSTELRPGGGFIDSYGIATFSGGQLTTADITDVDLLDRPFEDAGGQIPLPAAYTWFDLAPTWSFSDSNLDADFPTAARYAEQIYKQEGGKAPVQGVIAVTSTLIQRALAFTGPIAVPEYHDTVTAQNLIARIHYYQIGLGKQANNLTPSPGGPSSEPKRFTEVLATHFLAHIRKLSSPDLLKFWQLMINSLHSKDVQIYLNSSEAEHLLQSYHVDATIQSPSGDSLFVVDANIGANKASSFITNALNDQVTIDGQGNVVHHTTLSYSWVMQGQNYGSPLYQDYLRIYAPPGSILQTQDGWEPQGTSKAFGREVWAGFFTLSYRQTRTITLVWTVHGVAKKSKGGWDYPYTIQRQAGVQRALHLQVTLPSCAGKITTLGGLVASRPRVMSLTQTLNGDMNVGVNYTC